VSEFSENFDDNMDKIYRILISCKFGVFYFELIVIQFKPMKQFWERLRVVLLLQTIH